MDINTLRIAATLACFGTFLAILGWAFARSNRARFDADARIPLQGPDDVAGQPRSAGERASTADRSTR